MIYPSKASPATLSDFEYTTPPKDITAVMSLGGVVYSKSLRVAGDALDG